MKAQRPRLNFRCRGAVEHGGHRRRAGYNQTIRGQRGFYDEMITGAHYMLFSDDAAATRDFLRDVLGWNSIDAGGGWLVLTLPPTEMGVHPTSSEPTPGSATVGTHDLWLMCDDVEGAVSELTSKGVEFTQPIAEENFCVATRMRVPGGRRDWTVSTPTRKSAVVGE